MENENGFLNRLFHLTANGTTAKTEMLAGITTFMTMAYILAVNPLIMSTTGMDKGAVLTATAIASCLGTIFMAVFANYPFALAPGMGLNAFFAFTVVMQMGYSWQMALAAVFVEGIIFIVLSLTNVREAIFNAIDQFFNQSVQLLSYNIEAVTDGIDSQARVLVAVENTDTDTIFNSSGIDFDVLKASAIAYIHANTFVQKENAGEIGHQVSYRDLPANN